MEPIKHHHGGFMRWAWLFLLLTFSYIVGGAVVERQTAANFQAAAYTGLGAAAVSEQAPQNLSYGK